MVDTSQARLHAVEAIIANDGDCQPLPTCKNCPIACLTSDSTVEILAKAKEWLASQSIDKPSEPNRKPDAPGDLPAR